MLPGQCGECLGRKTPYAHPEGPASPFATGGHPDSRAEWQRHPGQRDPREHLRSTHRPKWIVASYDSECTRCGDLIVGGVDMIRSDEEGGWECCGP
jgi:hypothetical protein